LFLKLVGDLVFNTPETI